MGTKMLKNWRWFDAPAFWPGKPHGFSSFECPKEATISAAWPLQDLQRLPPGSLTFKGLTVGYAEVCFRECFAEVEH